MSSSTRARPPRTLRPGASSSSTLSHAADLGFLDPRSVDARTHDFARRRSGGRAASIGRSAVRASSARGAAPGTAATAAAAAATASPAAASSGRTAGAGRAPGSTTRAALAGQSAAEETAAGDLPRASSVRKAAHAPEQAAQRARRATPDVTSAPATGHPAVAGGAGGAQ